MAPSTPAQLASKLDADKEARSARQDVRTRQILDAAAKLMQQSGSHRVSMKAIADEVGMSVGLIYRYYENKEALVKAVIVGVLDEMAYEIPRAIEPVQDPVRRVAAAFTAYAELIRDNRRATLLTYRETYILDREGQGQVKSLELQTGQPMLQATQAAIDAGLFREMNARVFSYDLLIIAQAWALKHWYFSERMSFEEFVATQLSITLAGAIKPEHHETYADLINNA
ncbi:TetR/AcrR family transcriptional regulator [Corynebacterium sp. S7]